MANIGGAKLLSSDRLRAGLNPYVPAPRHNEVLAQYAAGHGA